MCSDRSGSECPVEGVPPLTRRRFLAVGAAAAGALVGARARPVAAQTTVDVGGVAVIPRSAWGGDLLPAGPLPAEPDVRYLLVHHSVDPGNDYAGADVPGILRSFVRFHTTGRGWPDLAYNFLVDRFGRVWEGRTGSVDGPVAGDATGGNQGFDQLCCFIGDHQAAPPSPQAFAAMGGLLAALARRHGVDLTPGTTATFISRGSNRYATGTEVTTATIAGHRDMSRTQCPGDLVYARLPELQAVAAGTAVRSPTTAPAPGPAPAPTPTTTAPAPAGTTAPPPTASSPFSPPTAATTSSVAPASAPGGSPVAGAPGSGGGPDGTGTAVAVAGAATAAAAAATATAWVRRREQATAPAPEDGAG